MPSVARLSVSDARIVTDQRYGADGVLGNRLRQSGAGRKDNAEPSTPTISPDRSSPYKRAAFRLSHRRGRELAGKIEGLICEARRGGLSDEKIIEELAEAAQALEEGLP